MPSKAATSQVLSQNSEKAFASCVHGIQQGFKEKQEQYGPHMYLVAGPLLYQGYLNSFPTNALQTEHNCRACADFIERAGRLAFIDEDGNIVPALWDSTNATGIYADPIAEMERIVRKSKISGQFFTDKLVMGRPHDGGFQHLNITLNSAVSLVGEDKQDAAMAIALEHHRNLTRALNDFNITLVRRVLKLLESESIKTGHLIEARTQWLEKIYVDIGRASVRRGNQSNIIWRYAATAPTGWCEIRGKLLGSLLKDLKDGLDDGDAIRNFHEASKGENYMRPTAEPTEGNINQAEKIIAAMGLAPSLERRFCGISEYPKLWEPTVTQQAKAEGGVFDSLRKTKTKTIYDAPTIDSTVMTWEKFARKILPKALSIKVRVPSGNASFGGFLTAQHADAPPLFQWDRESLRNPVSTYVYNGGSPASMWSLIANRWSTVLAFADMPWRINDNKMEHKLEGVLMVLHEAADTNNEGLSLFPQDMRKELHEIRKTIEAHSNDGIIGECPEDQSMAGIMMNSKGHFGHVLRVTTSLGVSDYTIDRWD